MPGSARVDRQMLAAVRRERLEEVARLRAAGTRLVGYLCIYAPVELIHAAGAIPVRLGHGGHEAELAGGKFLRADACSFCKSCLGGFETDPLYRAVDAVVAVNTCDMMRRLPESIERHFDKPVLSVYLPRTAEALPHRLAEFRRQLEELGKGLGRLTGEPVEDRRLAAATRACNEVRRGLRRVDQLRRGDRPAVKESELLDLVALAWLMEPRAAAKLLSTTSDGPSRPDESDRSGRPRLMLGGSMLAEDDHWLVELIEKRADIVADILCTGSRSFAEDVAEQGEPLDDLARFYFSRVPCMHRRPNDALYRYAQRLAAERRVAGFVYKTLLYCDPYNFEARRLKQALGLPMLHLDTDYSHENREQVRTRVEAFVEML